jgi:hypothetical protein
MLSSINPLGERARSQRYWATISSYVLGSVMGGAIMGSVGGLIGTVLPSGTWRLAVARVVALVGAILEILKRVPPSLHRQVDEDWLPRYRGWVYGFGFGAQLGLGVATIVTSASVYVTVALTVLSGSVSTGMLVGAVFGLVRAVPILSGANATDPRSLRALMRRLQDRLPTARVAVVASQVLFTVVATVVII